jgi:glycosyltransferase involved in cell wall biosynthesis
MEELRPDVVHTHGERTDVLHIGAARKLGVPAVTTVHGSSRLGGKARLHVPTQLCILRRFAAVVAVSGPIHESLSGLWVRPSRVHRIPNAWDGNRPSLDRSAARRRLGLESEGFVVGWVGRLIPVKGADLFLRAIARADPDIIACLIGDGGERDRIENLATSLGLEGRVRLAGAVDGAADFLPAFDALVLSSSSEGTPVVLFEAMAAGVPIVASAVGGVPDMLSTDEAILVLPGDPEALARAIGSVKANAAAAEARVRAADLRLRTEFDFETWLLRHERVYRSVLATRGRDHRPSASGPGTRAP